nr:uncharacterized protein LOC129260204 [Lytechinus pictus]
MAHNEEKETEAMMVDDGDSGMGSTDESGSRRDSLSSMASANSSATSSNDSAIGSMSDRRSSLSSNASSMSGMSERSFSSRSGQSSDAGYPDSVSSSRRSSLSSVKSDDSTTTIEIMVGDFNGKTHIVRARPTDTVRDLKCKIKDKVGVTPSQKQLTFQGRPLMNDASTVSSCGLQNLSTVQLQGRLVGGKDYMHRAGFV